MPGYLIHIAALPEEIRRSAEGLKGVVAADLWKNRTPSEQEYAEFFYGCEKPPTYYQVLEMCSREHGGTHFGSNPKDTNHANFKLLSSLFANGTFDAHSLFFKGYVHHLRLDHDFYADESIFSQTRFMDDYNKKGQTVVDMLHEDWNRTNNQLTKWYPELVSIDLPKEAKKVIGYSDGETIYVHLDQLYPFVNEMRKPKTLEELLQC